MKVWDLYARVYDALPRFYFAYQRLVEDVLSTVEGAVPAGGRILDAGCGTGNFSVELARRGYSVEGIDFSAGMLSRAKRKAGKAGLDNAAFRHWNIDDGLICYDDGTFDAVVSVHALYALAEPEKAIAEYFRVLKPGGRLIVAEPQHPIRIKAVAKEIYREGGMWGMARLAVTQLGVGLFNVVIGRRLRRGGYHYWDPEELISRLEKPGFSVDTVVPTYATNSLLLVNAAKPRFCFEMNGYKFLSADTGEAVEKVMRLRYQVYCVELGIRGDTEAGLEEDEHDEHAIHFLSVDEDGRPIATLRVVSDSANGFPMDTDFPLSEYVRANGISGAVEAGRWVIHKDIKSGKRGAVAFGLFKCLVDYCNEEGTNDMFCTTWPKVADKYDMPGLTIIGEPFRHSKLLGDDCWVVPMHCDIRRAYEMYLSQWQGTAEES